MPSTALEGGFDDARPEEDSSPPLPVIDDEPQAADIDLDIDIDLDLDIDLNVSKDRVKSEEKPNNLIDFDLPNFVRPNPGKLGKP
jgi:hypothetical protein